MNNRETIIENLMAIHKWAEDSMVKLNGVGIAESITSAVEALKSIVTCAECKYAHMTCNGENKCCDIISMADDEGDYYGDMYLPGDWYCAAGERREDG